MMSQHSTMPTPSSKWYTQNSGCYNSGAMNWQLSHPWRRFTLRQQQQKDSLNQLQTAVRADFLAFLAHQTAAPARSAWLLGLFLCSCGGDSAVSPSIEFLIFVQVLFLTARASQPHVSRLLLPLLCSLAVFALFTLPILQISSQHIELLHYCFLHIHVQEKPNSV